MASQDPKPPAATNLSAPSTSLPFQSRRFVVVAAPSPTKEPSASSSFRKAPSATSFSMSLIDDISGFGGSVGRSGPRGASRIGSCSGESSSTLADRTGCWVPLTPRSFKTRVSSVLNESLAKTSLTWSSSTEPRARSCIPKSNSRERTSSLSLRFLTASSLFSRRLSPTLPGISSADSRMASSEPNC